MFCSMIIPIYNPEEQHFIRLLKSIQLQKDKDFKVYFINDCGATDFKKHIQDILIDIQYEIIDLDHNIGQGLARQVALDICNDDWVTFIDQDDSISENMVSAVKKIANDTNASFVIATRSVVANNEEWTINQQYTVENSLSVLHGKFYNRKKIKKYNIHFSDKVRAHEDTFFQNLIFNYLALDEELRSNEKSYIESDVITYFWYLWKDSTSHAKNFDPVYFNNISYLEKNVKDYVIATIEAYKEVKNKYTVTEEYLYNKFISFLYFIYWFIQSFEYFNPIGWKKNNLIWVKKARDFVIQELNTKDIKGLTNILIDMPKMYYFTFNEVFSNINGFFVPRLTIEQFYQGIEDRMEKFNIKET